MKAARVFHTPESPTTCTGMENGSLCSHSSDREESISLFSTAFLQPRAQQHPPALKDKRQKKDKGNYGNANTFCINLRKRRLSGLGAPSLCHQREETLIASEGLPGRRPGLRLNQDLEPGRTTARIEPHRGCTTRKSNVQDPGLNQATL
eukprot:282808-Pelagomonas_calceolata.AAC.4